MKRRPAVLALLALTVVLFTQAACGGLVDTTPVVSSDGMLLPMSPEVSISGLCEGCAQATLEALQTQEKDSSDAQAAATAAIMRANAQATLNAVNATVSAAQTQEKNKANVIAAQIAATAAILRANAQATLDAADSTQSAAQTQDANRQAQVQFDQQMTASVATQIAAATITQQNNNFLASGTQTVVANLIATQTQSAVATNQWYADQARQRDEQRMAPITFLLLWCPPLFIVAIGLVCLIFFWRWMRIRETQQLIDMQPEPPLIIEYNSHQESDPANNHYLPAVPTDQVHGWLEEAKRNLIAREEDEDDNPES